MRAFCLSKHTRHMIVKILLGCLPFYDWGGGPLCARQIFETIFLKVFVKHYGPILSDISYLRITWHM